MPLLRTSDCEGEGEGRLTTASHCKVLRINGYTVRVDAMALAMSE